MSDVAIFLHSGRSDALETAADVVRWLQSRGHRVRCSGDESLLLTGAGVTTVPDDLSDPPDLVVSVGGDGTMLRATRRAVAGDAPILGVNLGRLGYLAEVEPWAWADALTAFFEGRHTITERMLAAATITDPAGSEAPAKTPPALNEVVIEKETLGRTIRLGVSIDGEFFTNYVADGVIIATPTGSTAYSLSARGPIVAPTHHALLLTPVSPHSLFDRSLILEPTSTVDLTVLGDRPASVAVDGDHLRVLQPGSIVTVTSHPRPARVVSLEHLNFHQVLKAKFGLNDR